MVRDAIEAGGSMRRFGLYAVIALLLAGCSTPSQSVKKNPESSPAVTKTSQGTPSTSGTTPEPSVSTQAGVGDSITLKGTDDGLVMEVKLVKVLDPAEPADEFFTPDKGNRFVAFQLRLTNVGTVTYDDSPSNGAVLLDAEDQSYTSDFDDVKGCQGFAGGGAKVAPGDSSVGCIVYQLPNAATASGFQFTLDSGFGPETGQWTL